MSTIGLSLTDGQNQFEQYIPINTAVVGSSRLFMAHSWLIKIKTQNHNLLFPDSFLN